MYENSVLKNIEKADTVYITGHINPDGDCIGSVFGLAMAMAKLGKKPVILIDEYSERYNILKGREYVFKGDYDSIKPDVMFSVDCAGIERMGKAEAVFKRAEYTCNIDHHISNSSFACENIVNPKASSACEVVYEIIKDIIDIDRDIASALYTGILTDTGGFMHNSTSERTHQIAGKLVSAGVDTPYIHTKFLMEHSLTETKIFTMALERMKLENKTAYTFVTKEDMEECNASSKDLEGIASYLLNTEGAEVSLFASERDEGCVKLSFRSKAINVNEIASLLGGGGHILASGASVKGSIEDVMTKGLNEIWKRLK